MEIRHGYLAAISYFDAQVGRVLTELDSLGLYENTIVIFWSDHGYHLGEHSLWAKTSNFELDARVPLIITTPQQKQPGIATNSLVELLDLYPTLCDLCGLSMSKSLEGTSLVPIVENPDASVKEAAFTQHPRPAYFKGEPKVMGRSVRTNHLRYTEWRDAKTNKVVATELYDHRQDVYEQVNVAQHPAYTREIIEGRRLYQAGFGK